MQYKITDDYCRVEKRLRLYIGYNAKNQARAEISISRRSLAPNLKHSVFSRCKNSDFFGYTCTGRSSDPVLSALSWWVTSFFLHRIFEMVIAPEYEPRIRGLVASHKYRMITLLQISIASPCNRYVSLVECTIVGICFVVEKLQ